MRRAESGHLRLRGGRHRYRRCGPGEPPERGRSPSGLRPGGRGQGLAPVPPRPGRVHEDADRPVGQLALRGRAERGHRGTQDRAPARKDVRGVELDQRPHLQPWSAHGFRHLGTAWQPGVELRRRAALLPAQRVPHRAGGRPLPGPRRGVRGGGPRLAPPAVRGVHRRSGEHRHPAQPRLQRRAPGGGRLLPAQRPPRPPHEHRAGAPAARHAAAQRRGPPARPRHARPARGQPRGGCRVSARGRTSRGTRHPRGGRLGRRRQLPAAPPALRHRPTRAPRPPRHSRSQGAARGGREPARSLRDPHRVPGPRNPDHQRACTGLAAGGGGREVLRAGHRDPDPAADPGALLLEIERGARRGRPADHLHSGELPCRRAVHSGGPAGRHRRGVAAPAGELRTRPGAERRPPREARDPAELPGRRDGPAGRRGRHPARPAADAHRAARAVLRARGAARRRGAHRRRDPRLRPGDRHHRISLGRDLPDGAGDRPPRGRRRSPPRARHRGPAGRRRVDHAAHDLRQHQRGHPDDRGEGGGHDPGRAAPEPAALP